MKCCAPWLGGLRTTLRLPHGAARQSLRPDLRCSVSRRIIAERCSAQQRGLTFELCANEAKMKLNGRCSTACAASQHD
jgi:hypothetical protein